MYNWDYIYQVRDQYKKEVQSARDKVISDFITDANNQMSQIKDKYIKAAESVDPIVALLKLTRNQAIVKAMSTDELKDAAFSYKNNGFIDDPQRNDIDYLNILMGELGSRGAVDLVKQMKDSMQSTWHTNEPWKQDSEYNDLQGQLDAIKVMNELEPDGISLHDASGSNNWRNTHYEINELIA